MSSRYHTKNGRTSKRGAFINGFWQCDCEPRLPASKFQTKNGGKNHGRWFYTCQKSQPKRCDFFLWTDDAKVREESAVLSNSRSEPITPQTPRTTNSLVKAPTSPTRPKTPPNNPKATSEPESDRTVDFERENSFDWPSSADEELVEVAIAFETPRKAARTDEFSSPGKRNHPDTTDTHQTWGTMRSPTEDVFKTPSTSRKPNEIGLLSPAITPAHLRLQSEQPFDSNPLPLAMKALEILKPANLDKGVETELIELLDNHDLRTKGILKGREITRLAVQSKDKKISELQARIIGLEAERETSRTVIAHLKQDIAASPKRGRGKD